MKETNTIKKSFIASSLTTSAGIFITKLIGLFYIVPFKAIVGQQDMIYYSAAMERSNTRRASKCENVVAGAGSVKSSAGT